MQQERGGAQSEEIREAVRNPRRRYLLYFLDRNGGEASLEEAVRRIAAWETSTDPERTTEAERKSVYSSLYQTHLPKLEEVGLVRFDSERGTVATTRYGARVRLRFATDWYSYPWPTLILGYGFLQGFLVLFGPTLFPGYDTALSAVCVALFIAVALSQLYEHRSWKRRFQRSGPDYVVEFDDR